jgi:hypothetical protein
MTVGALELHAAVVALWNNSELDWACKQYWETSKVARWPSLGESMLGPECPFPYATFTIGDFEVISRTTGLAVGIKRAIRSAPLTFTIYAKQLPANARTAKTIAASILDQLLQVFGGHPTVRPQRLECVHSHFLNCQYETDYGMTVEDDVYQHVVSYRLMVDSPIGI